LTKKKAERQKEKAGPGMRPARSNSIHERERKQKWKKQEQPDILGRRTDAKTRRPTILQATTPASQHPHKKGAGCALREEEGEFRKKEEQHVRKNVKSHKDWYHGLQKTLAVGGR